MPDPSVRIAIGSIVWREYTWPHHVSMLRLMQLQPTIEPLVLAGDALVSRARGIVATRFARAEKQDVLVFIDSDIQFDPRDVITVAEQAHATRGIVGAAYTVRRADGSFPACMLPNDVPVRFYDPSESPLVPLEYASGGFMAIDRSVFQRLAVDGVDRAVAAGESYLLHAGTTMEHFPWFQPLVDGERYLSEDWAFCHRARALGVPIQLNPHVRLRHIGAYGHHMEDMVTEYPSNGIVRVTRHGDAYQAEMLTAHE